VNTLLDINERFAVGPSDRVLAISSLSFDLSVYDFFGTLAAGAAVVLLSPDLARDPAHWLAQAGRHRVSIWNSVPALLGMLVEYAESEGMALPASLRLAMLSGDWIPVTLPNRVRGHLPALRVVSLGGATEASIWSICFPIGEVPPDWRSIPYGKALKNQRFYVLDDFLQQRPVWVPGQLYIGGIGLAKGYWRDEAQTAASFITHPLSGERLYRTGDMGRYLPDGNIEFLGREDNQVKVQGYRIELGEIEAALEDHPAVEAAVVRAWGAAQGEKRLAAYVVADLAAPDAGELSRHLAGKLPSYMVPASFTFLDALPLSANGKVDRSRLPEPVRDQEEAGPALVLEGPEEHRIVAIVEDALELDGIGPVANLLNLGATSIDVVRIGNALSGELGFRPHLAQLLAQPTLANLIAMYREDRGRKLITETAQRAAAGAQDQAIEDRTIEDRTIEDPGAREAFKARRLGRRVLPAAGPAVALPLPADDAFARRFSEYRSVRRFRQDAVEVRLLADLLACLSQGSLDGAPKYQFPSAGGLYPVQTYLYVKPDRVQGMAAGAYYYDPGGHRLVPTGRGRSLDADAYDYFVNRPTFEGAAFALFFVAELAAIQPMYGEKSLDFCHIEAGAMAQLLTAAAAELGLGLCGIGSVDPGQVAPLLELGPTHRAIYSMVGGLRLEGADHGAPVEAFRTARAEREVEMEDIEV
jgi:SagB-type dehydrogenase family enzyme